MSYPRYTWIGNKISEKDIRIKMKSRRPITANVAEAVRDIQPPPQFQAISIP
jgi:hypothetical protein